jgi:hypothetical protein
MDEIDFEKKKQKVPLSLLRSIFASNIQGGDSRCDDKASLRSESIEAAQLFLSSTSLCTIATGIVEADISFRIVDDHVYVVILSKAVEEKWLYDRERRFLLSHILSVS